MRVPKFISWAFWACMTLLIALLLWLLLTGRYYVVGENSEGPPSSMHKGPYEGVGVYTINLDRSPDRWNRIQPLIHQLGWPSYRIPGVDGQFLSDEVMAQKIDFPLFQSYLGRLPGRGEMGCFMGHERSWRAFLNSPHAYALVFEDDTTFMPPVLKQVVEELIQNNRLWDFCNLDIRKKGHRLRGFFTLKQFPGYALRVYYQGVYCGNAYLMNRRAAKRLLEKMYPIRLTVEDYFARGWEFGLKYTAVSPSAATITDVPSVSEETTYRKPTLAEQMSVLSTKINCVRYRFNTSLIRLIHAVKVAYFPKTLEGRCS